MVNPKKKLARPPSGWRPGSTKSVAGCWRICVPKRMITSWKKSIRTAARNSIVLTAKPPISCVSGFQPVSKTTSPSTGGEFGPAHLLAPTSGCLKFASSGLRDISTPTDGLLPPSSGSRYSLHSIRCWMNLNSWTSHLALRGTSTSGWKVGGNSR